MSMETSFVYGCGFEISSVKTETIVRFIKNHKKAFCETVSDPALYDELVKTEDIDEARELLESCTCIISGREGMYSVVSNIISSETGISFQYEPGQDDCIGEASILLSDTMPWSLNKKEMDLTWKSFVDVLTPYVKELGLDQSVIGRVEIEYFG